MRKGCGRSRAGVITVASAKEELVKLVKGMKPKGWEEVRGAVNELLPKVEREEQGEECPATSSRLNGRWQIAFSAGPAPGRVSSPTRELALFLYEEGVSPGIAGLMAARQLPDQLVQLDDVELDISPSQPRAKATAKGTLAGRSNAEVSILCDLEVVGDNHLRERYTSVEIDGRSFNLPEQLRYSRDLYLAFLDDDLLVCRTSSGTPEILLRASPESGPSSNAATTTTPTTTAAPGTNTANPSSTADPSFSSSGTPTEPPEPNSDPAVQSIKLDNEDDE